MKIVPSEGMTIVTVQDTFEDVINDVESKVVESESIWVARRFSVDEDHQEFYKVDVKLDGNEKVLFESSDVQISRHGDHKYTFAIKGDQYEMLAPKHKTHTANNVTAVAITKNGNSLIVGNTNGDIIHYDTATKQKLLEFKEAHYAGILKLKLFPSEQVLLSVGNDLQIKLWSLERASEVAVRSFVNQKKEISDIALIGKGRNFMTSSLDGSVNLWECSTGSIVSKFQRIDDLEDPSTCLAIATAQSKVSYQDSVGGDLLFECNDKFVYVGYQSGLIQQYSVAGHYQTGVKFKVDSEVASLGIFSDYVIAGYGNGQIIVWNTTADQHFTFKLNENYPVSNLHLENWNGKRATFIVSNGPDLLLRAVFDGSDGSFHYRYLVGLRELFHVELVTASSRGVIVATLEEMVEYT